MLRIRFILHFVWNGGGKNVLFSFCWHQSYLSTNFYRRFSIKKYSWIHRNRFDSRVNHLLINFSKIAAIGLSFETIESHFLLKNEKNTVYFIKLKPIGMLFF